MARLRWKLRAQDELAVETAGLDTAVCLGDPIKEDPLGNAWPVSFDRIAEAHRRIEAGGLDGKLILCPERSP